MIEQNPCPIHQLSERPGSVWNCLWGHVLKIFLGSIVRVWYCFPVPDLYLVLHGLCCRKSTKWINQSINQQVTGRYPTEKIQRILILTYMIYLQNIHIITLT